MFEYDDLNEAAEAKAREALAIEMHSIGVDSAIFLYDDMQSAFLHAKQSDEYAKVATYLGVEYDGVDSAPVNDALFKRYHQLFAEAKEQLRKGRL